MLLPELSLPGVRWLGPGDGQRLVDLVRACYGETYSYAAFYQPEEIEALWASGSLLSLGHVDDQGRLGGHTGFWNKDPNREYVESGLSLIRPDARRGFAVEPATMWRMLLEHWARTTEFMHQNTTTRHVRAQLYAARYMRARPTGWIFDYAIGEVLVGLAEAPAPMHALTMTTALSPHGLAPTLAVPEGPWAGWLARVVGGALPEAVVVPVAYTRASTSTSLAFEPIEWNPSLALRRRAVRLTSDVLASSDASSSPARVDLVHLPMLTEHVAAAWSSLLARGYLPVGVRPHRRRPSEIVLQFLPRSDRCADMIASMSLAGPPVQRLATEWLQTCERTS